MKFGSPLVAGMFGATGQEPLERGLETIPFWHGDRGTAEPIQGEPLRDCVARRRGHPSP